MIGYLCKTVETYRVSSESDAARLIAEAKADNRFQVLKSSTEYKAVKQKGETVDEYWKVDITKEFTNIKEPDASVEISYKVEQGFFPSSQEEE